MTVVGMPLVGVPVAGMAVAGMPVAVMVAERPTGRLHALGRSRMTDPTPATGAEAPFDLARAFDEHGRVLLGFCVNAVRDHGLAEDCVQETFVRAWRSRDSYDPLRSSVRTWLFVIARSVVVDALRAAQRRPRLVDAETLAESPADVPDPLDRLRIVEGLARLSPEHREVIVDVHLRGASYAEVSERTGVAVATLRSRSFYALRALRIHLDETKADHD